MVNAGKYVCAFTAALTLALLSILSAGADLVISAPESVKPKEQLVVRLVVGGEESVSGLHFRVTCGEGAECVKVQALHPGSVRTDYESGGAESVIVFDEEAVGEIAELTFKTDESAQGSLPISVEVIQSVGTNCEDAAQSSVSCIVAVEREPEQITRAGSASASVKLSGAATSKASSKNASSKAAKSAASPSKKESRKASSAATEDVPSESFASSNTFTRLDSSDNKYGFAAAGAAAALSAAALLFVAYRLGQTSAEKKK